MMVKQTYFIVVNFDYLYLNRDRMDELAKELFNWMEERTKQASERDDVRYKVFMTHRPFLCSDLKGRDCFINLYIFRMFEDLLLREGFDLALNGHIHAYIRHKPMNGLTVKSNSDIGEDAMVTIINGHSGTGYKFPNVENNTVLHTSFVDRIDVSYPTYVKLDISKDSLVSRLVRSDTNEVIDTFNIERRTQKDIVYSLVYNVIVILSISIILIFIMCVFIRFRNNKDNTSMYASIADQSINAESLGNHNDK